MKQHKARHAELQDEDPLSPVGLILGPKVPHATNTTPSRGLSLDAQARTGFSQPVDSLAVSPEALMDLLPTKWQRYAAARAQLKGQYEIAKT
jgi:hypothetical protein